MKNKFQTLIIVVVALSLSTSVFAQDTSANSASATNVVVATNAPAVAVVHVNTAIVPVSRDARSLPRQNLVLQRAKDNPGKCDIAFIGDSITQGWEGNGKNVWAKYYGSQIGRAHV